ncbi:MAG: transposase [Cyanobacteria bacterium J06626_18]
MATIALWLLVLALTHLLEDAKCSAAVRRLRWRQGPVKCPHCEAPSGIKQGKDDAYPHRQRYAGTACEHPFDDLTGTVFMGHHQPFQMGVFTV